MRPQSLLAGAAILLVACAPLVQKREFVLYRTYEVKSVVEGTVQKNVLSFSETGHPGTIAITRTDRHSGQTAPAGPEAVHLLLAFQLAPGKTPEDFAAFKKIDLPWVASNHGANPTTCWTKRDDTWEFDAFEDATFASMDDFKRAYAGNDELTKAGEGLFGPKVLVAVVR